MFDIGFAELILVAVVGLLVIGPERLPGAIRTGSQWLSHFKRSFNTMKREIEHELEIDSVKNQLGKANEQFKSQSDQFKRNLAGNPDPTNTSQEKDSPESPEEQAPSNPTSQGKPD